MKPHSVSHMFSLEFEKTADEIKEKAISKIEFLREKIVDRTERIRALREQHDIDDAAYVQLLEQYQRHSHAATYTYSSPHSNATVRGSGSQGMEERTIGAGVVMHLSTESSFIAAEKEAVKRLDTLVRNLRPLKRVTENGVEYDHNGFGLSYDELDYLGF